MPSSDAKIYKAVIEQLRSYATLPDVVEQGDTYDPNPLVPFIYVDDLRFDNVRMFVADGPHKQYGSLMLSVMCPSTWTYMQCLEYAGKVADHFADGVVMTYDDVEIRTDKHAQVINSGYQDGTHFRLTVQCPWVGMV